MVTKTMRQSSRNAMDIDRQFGRTGRAYKITPNRWAKETKKSIWQRMATWFKSKLGGK
jgi:hypothetical protein